MATVTRDWGDVQTALEEGAKTIMFEMIDGTIEELDGDIRLGAQLLLAAAKRRDMDKVVEVRDALALIAIEKGLKMQYAAEGLAERVLELALGALVDGAIAGLSGVKVLP
jgi:hypothetical protein